MTPLDNLNPGMGITVSKYTILLGIIDYGDVFIRNIRQMQPAVKAGRKVKVMLDPDRKHVMDVSRIRSGV
jgi:hypothetical protein